MDRDNRSPQSFANRAARILLVLGMVFILTPIACRLPFSPPVTETPGTTGTNPTATVSPATALTPTLQTPPVVVIQPDSQVRRLSASVFAGKQLPLAEVISDDLLQLDAGGMVTTDRSGEAEITLQDCLKLFVFQDTTLTRATCRKEDAASGLAVCGTAGMTGVINNCTSQVNVLTPGSNVITTGTQFAVIYLPADQLSIVQVYEGAVNVSALLDPSIGSHTQPQALEAGKMWFTAPGDTPPTVGGVTGREPQPMEVWGAVRSSLVDTYPDLDTWMNAAQKRMDPAVISQYQNALIVPSGEVALETVGTYFTDNRVQAALLQAVPWRNLIRDSWGKQVNIVPSVRFADRAARDPRLDAFDAAKAQESLKQVRLKYAEGVTVLMATEENDSAAALFAEQVSQYLVDAGFKIEAVHVQRDELPGLQKKVQSSPNTAMIYIHTSGSAFPGGT
jgi:hypothetical protein